MGLFKALFGSSNSKVNLTDLKQKTEQLRADNKAWESDFEKVTSLRKQAQDLEKNKDLEKAIETYILSINTGEKSKRLTFNNYAFDIHRVIIVLGKTKQKEQLREFLREKIEKYPTVAESENWKDRLQKLESK
ncbi:hypothetical protein HC174_16385 [Salinimicrobium sp. CDJ15-81-2]|nr:hypothetical protein [Salinimicrobium nanhaiense]